MSAWRIAGSTIGATLGVFVLALAGMAFVQQQFFPSSDRPELIVDWNLPQNASIQDTNDQMARFEREMLADEPDVDHWSTYVGEGARRFVLSFDVQPANIAFGQTVILTRSIKARDRLRAKYHDWLRKTFPGTDAFVHLLDIGPPVGRPVQYRVSGPDLDKVRDYAQALGNIVAKNRHLGDVTFDWMEPARMVRVNVLQDKARTLGVSSQDIAATINGVINGSDVTQLRDDIYLVDVIARARGRERGSVETLQNLQLPAANGQSVPLAAVASFSFGLEQPTIWRRSRLPTITLKVAVTDDVQPATVVNELAPKVKAFSDSLPQEYKVEVGGAVEESAKAQGPINAVMPLMLFIMATILMIQLQILQQADPGLRRRAAGFDRRGDRSADEQCADGLRRHARRSRADRHSHPQFGDPDRADRHFAARGRGALGGGARGDPEPHAADHADGRRRDSGADPDLARNLLGADGVRDDGRHRRRHGADFAVPSRPLSRLVPHSRSRRARLINVA